MPILVSLLGAGLFSIPALVGAAMLFGRTTAELGKRILTYSLCTLVVGVACCWLGFALMMFVWSRGDPAVMLFWASIPLGLLLGPILAHRFLRARR
jgi:hypothetical protein